MISDKNIISFLNWVDLFAYNRFNNKRTNVIMLQYPNICCSTPIKSVLFRYKYILPIQPTPQPSNHIRREYHFSLKVFELSIPRSCLAAIQFCDDFYTPNLSKLKQFDNPIIKMQSHKFNHDYWFLVSIVKLTFPNSEVRTLKTHQGTT